MSEERMYLFVHTKEYSTEHDSTPKTLWEKHKFMKVAMWPEKMKEANEQMIPI
jgi:hypothetical protein